MKKEIIIGLVIGLVLAFILYIGDTIIDYNVEKTKTELHREKLIEDKKSNNKQYRILIKNVNNNTKKLNENYKSNRDEHDILSSELAKTNKEISNLIYVIKKNNKDMKQDLDEIKKIYSDNLIVDKNK